ncbi:uncharacterized protein LOC113355780 [Papaver somniferum]|uniref:uncharacterized protein LOC113355780 n=1 Tax=Papaver somniferum TaxID=3469 RepID=UPI000E6FFD4E|nr:uncharacterized protein LOC113355780 [Papaver somniferum]
MDVDNAALTGSTATGQTILGFSVLESRGKFSSTVFENDDNDKSVNHNFRNVNGWTALHWVSFDGREQTVGALLTLGVAPKTLSGPSPKFLSKRTPADLVSANRRKGIVDYLAEYFFTTHLPTFALKGREEDGFLEISFDEFLESSLDVIAIQIFSERSPTPDTVGIPDLSLKDSLTTPYNANQAATHIHLVFRVQSFQKKQLKEIIDDKISMADERTLCHVTRKSNKSKQTPCDDKLDHFLLLRIRSNQAALHDFVFTDNFSSYYERGKEILKFNNLCNSFVQYLGSTRSLSKCGTFTKQGLIKHVYTFEVSGYLWYLLGTKIKENRLLLLFSGNLHVLHGKLLGHALGKFVVAMVQFTWSSQKTYNEDDNVGNYYERGKVISQSSTFVGSRDYTTLWTAGHQVLSYGIYSYLFEPELLLQSDRHDANIKFRMVSHTYENYALLNGVFVDLIHKGLPSLVNYSIEAKVYCILKQPKLGGVLTGHLKVVVDWIVWHPLNILHAIPRSKELHGIQNMFFFIVAKEKRCSSS